VPGGSLELGFLSLLAVAAIYAVILGWTAIAPRLQRAAALTPTGSCWDWAAWR
jgi:hypothetical protein